VKVSLVQPMHADHKVVRTGKGGVFKPAQLTMPLLAACTPPDIEVEIHDEIVRPLDIERIAGDVVGITAVTPFAPRAYAIAAQLRARGQTVIMGGPHASALPDEARQFVDAVVVGEGDVLWPRALRDFQRGELAPIYRNEAPPPIEDLPRPRWELLDPAHYIIPQVVQATRGCPFSCEFCSLRNVFPGYRTRPVADVVREVEQIPYRDVVFWDDNIIGSPKYARELFQALKPLGKRWFSQATITIARSKELVRLAAESGCAGLFVGLESFRKSSLAETHKQFNHVERYKQDLRLLADHGITVMSGLIFGFDEDTPSTFAETLEGAIEIGLTGVACSILTPYPGTGLYARMKAAGRLTTSDWSRYSSDEVVFVPRNLSPEQLIEGHNWVGQQFHRLPNILRRWWNTGFVQPQVFLLSNLANRRYFSHFPPVRRHPGRDVGWVPPPPAPPPDDAPHVRRLPVIGRGAGPA
jgi:radical SAM superfamily enzyme YgiQ (UPF0313 family)